MSQVWVKQTSGSSIGSLISDRFGMTMEEYEADLEKEYEIPGLEKVAEELYKAAKAGVHIESANDFDVDGIMSSANMAIVKEILESSCGPVSMRIKVPKRFSEGFGIREEYTSKLHDCLLITADNGVAAIDAVKKAKENGCTVLITDHHEPVVDESGKVVLPEADVIVDPHVTGGEFVEYCGAGIVYKLAKLCMEKYGDKIPSTRKKFLMNAAKVNATVATICDSVPMVGENRKIVKEGLDLYTNGCCSLGLKMLKSSFGHTIMDEGMIGFSEGPALNAYGRLEDDGSQKVAEAMSFLGEWDSEVSNLIQQLRTMNDLRKKQVSETMKSMDDYINKTGQEHSGVIIVQAECNVGIAGIIAGRITDKYKKPSIVLVDIGDGKLKGSGRSIEGVNIKEVLDANSSLIFEYGGHAAACGITLDKKMFNDFANAIHEYVPEEFLPDMPEVGYDLVMKSPKFLEKAYNMIKEAGPWGEGNPEPVLLVKDVELDGFTALGNESDYCKAKIKGTPFEVFAGGDAAKFLLSEKPATTDIVCTLSMNIFRGKGTLQVSPVAIDHAGRDHSLEKKDDIER